MTTQVTGTPPSAGNGVRTGAAIPGAAGAVEVPVTAAAPALVARSTPHTAHTPHTGLPVAAAMPAAPSKAPAGRRVPKTRRPHADCTADSAGGLTFDVRLTDKTNKTNKTNKAGGAAGASDAVTTAVATTGDAALLLHRRGGGGGPADTVRLPLGLAGTDGTLRAVLPSIMTLPEGRWDAYLALADAEPQRLLPGVHDLRSLIDRVPRQGRTWLGVRIPYATKYGNLTVRSWLRWPHAEAGRLRVEDGRLLLHGGLYGARLGATARLEARTRDAAASRTVSVPASRDAGVGIGEYGPGEAESASDFTAELPLAALPSEHRVWDLWLRPEEGAEPVRVARLLDDVPDKRQIFSYPPQRVSGTDGDRVVRPYYTLDNDLSVRVSCAAAV